MALLKALCWALIFIIRIRFPPGTSLAMILNIVNHFRSQNSENTARRKQHLSLDSYDENFRKLKAQSFQVLVN